MSKLSIIAVFILVFAILGYYAYESLPSNSVSLSPTTSLAKDDVLADRFAKFEGTPVFMNQLRFGDATLTFFLDDSCSEKRKDKMREAFSMLGYEVEVLSFVEVLDDSADILVGCSNEYIPVGEDLFAAGEGGPSRIVKTDGFNVIEQGKISLFKKSECDYPVVELHELGHVLGFDHTTYDKSVMFDVADCNQKLTSDMIDYLKELYSIPSLPDLVIGEVSASTTGRYLNFEVTVTNTGLVDASDVSLGVYADGFFVDAVDLEGIKVGYGRTLTLENMKLPSRDSSTIMFFVDYDNLVEEFDEEDNVVVVSQNNND